MFSPPGNLVGTVEQTWSVCTPEFDVKNESGSTVLKIEGPVCRYGICGDVEFKVCFFHQFPVLNFSVLGFNILTVHRVIDFITRQISCSW